MENERERGIKDFEEQIKTLSENVRNGSKKIYTNGKRERWLSVLGIGCIQTK